MAGFKESCLDEQFIAVGLCKKGIMNLVKYLAQCDSQANAGLMTREVS